MKRIFLAVAAVTLPMMMLGQSSIDAYNLSQPDLRGTARFMGMAGAFTALGGDLSTLAQNPGGIGLYRSSEVGITLDVDFESSNTYSGTNTNATHAMVPNLGYIGATKVNLGPLSYFNWGVTYSRRATFNRTVHGSIGDLQVSLSDFAAFSAAGYSPEELGYERKMDAGIQNPSNPYDTSNADWLAILAYNSYMIHPLGGGSSYTGLFNDDPDRPATTGFATYDIRQRGYMDEYNVDLGGNFMDTFFWGIGFGLTDISLRSETYYNETLDDAVVNKAAGTGNATMTGAAYNSLGNYSSVSGMGFNFKIGFIVKPIQEWRIGFAVQTPTWYDLNQTRSGDLYYEYYKYNADNQVENTPFNSGTSYTNNSTFDWKLRTPWRLSVGTAAVLAGRLILSADYEYSTFRNMRVENGYGNEDQYVADDITHYFKNQNTIRLGGELRVTPQFSLRAGFANTSSGIQEGVNGSNINIYTNGAYLDNTNPAYTFDTNTRYLTCGAGYKYRGFYADIAYVNKYQKCTYHPFSSFGGDGNEILPERFVAPSAKYAISHNNLVISVGFKF